MSIQLLQSEAPGAAIGTIQEINSRLEAFKMIKATTTTKCCLSCGQIKSTTEFYNRKSRLDGLSTRCKECEMTKVNQWKKDNPDKMRAIYVKDKQRRRCLTKSQPHLSLKEFEDRKAEFENQCAYCGENAELSQDHFYPIGSKQSMNPIIPACKKCNSSKNNKKFKGWYPHQTFFSNDREAKIMSFINKSEQRHTV